MDKLKTQLLLRMLVSFFKIIGSGRVWRSETPASVYGISMNVFPPEIDWAPDGCKVLFATSRDLKNWILLSIFDLTYEKLPQIGIPIWSLDGRNIFFLQYRHSEDVPNFTDVYVADSVGQNQRLLRSGEWMTSPQWLSNSELLYQNLDYGWSVWDIKTNNVYPFYANGEAKPSDLKTSIFYDTDITSLSPNRIIQAGYFSLPSFRGATNSDTTVEDRATLEPFKPKIPGFDLYFLKEGTNRHIDLAGQFVQSLIWSPSSKKIAITTDYDGTDYGVFVYDIDTDVLQRVGDAYNDYQIYIPSWSPDEEWLDLRTPTGYFIQRLLDGKRIPLDDRITGHRLYWSPVMDYSKSQCEK